MKKLILLFGIVLGTLLLTGCDGNVTRDIRHAGFGLSQEYFVCTTLMPADEETPAQENILFSNGSFAITESGRLYELSLSQPYSNNENCRKISFSIDIIAYMDSTILKGIDNKFYYAPGANNNSPLSEVPQTEDEYQIYNIVLGNANVKKAVTVNSSQGIYYVLESDGTVYQYTVTKQNNDSPYQLQAKTPIYSSSEYGNIIDFNYAGDSGTTYVKTEDTIYRMRATNEEECTKYADVPCNYKMQKDETLTKYYKEEPKILYYGPSILITTYGKEFTPAS